MLNENLVTSMMQSIVSGYEYSHAKMFGLDSLYISEHKRKYVVGDQVIIENGILMNTPGEVPTHEITLLQGTLSDNKHRITLRSLSTNEVNTIEL